MYYLPPHLTVLPHYHVNFGSGRVVGNLKLSVGLGRVNKIGFTSNSLYTGAQDGLLHLPL